VTTTMERIVALVVGAITGQIVVAPFGFSNMAVLVGWILALWTYGMVEWLGNKRRADNGDQAV